MIKIRKQKKLMSRNRIISIENNIITFEIVYLKTQKFLGFIDLENKDVLKHSWCLKINKKNNDLVCLHARYQCQKISLHRLITNCPKGMDVDHINGNVLDNRKCNLRVCSHSDNLKNQKNRSNNTSGFKGVSYMKSIKKFRSYIVKDNKQFNLGCYETKEDAALAYNEAAIKLHGEFARLNII